MFHTATLPPRGRSPIAGALAALLYLSAMGTIADDIEQVVVTARQAVDGAGRGLHGFDTTTHLDQAMSLPVNLATLVANQPGVDFNGQGGLFQTVSVRGLSRQRVGSFFLDIPILTERRAGTAASFIDPSMLSAVELVRGPATTAWGSGNIGGLIRSRVAPVEGLEAGLSWGGSGDENSQFMRLGNGSAWGAASRRASSNAETPDGDPLHTEFEQYNLLVGGRLESEAASYDLVSLASYGRDIGKSNARFPDERITHYPLDRHWLGQLTRVSDASTTALYFHYQDLETEVLRPGDRINTVENSAFDFGARYVSSWLSGERWRWGLDYLGRRNVDSDEWEQDLGEPRGPRQATLRGEQDDLAGFVEGRADWGATTFTGGLRLSWINQEAQGWSRESDSLVSGYLGFNRPLNEYWAVTGELSRGARTAGLSEKFFSGTTGRGTVVGNPDLTPESADSLDLGLVRRGGSLDLEFHIYQMELDDFIERLPTGEDELSYRNLSGGRIQGADFHLGWPLSETLVLQFDGHWQHGEDGRGNPLQDVSPDRLGAGLLYESRGWRWSLDYRHRFAKRDVAAGEQAVGSADLLGFTLHRSISESLSVSVWGRNLLNESYLLTTDDLSTDAEKVSFGVELAWRSGGP